MSSPAKPIVSVIVAMARNRVIGVNNSLPWRLPEDLRYFKALTLGHHILMGRKTYESIGRPLPGRTTVIISRDPLYKVEGCLTAHSIDQALELARDDSEVFFVGGADLYAQALPFAQRLYITEIRHDYPGDAHFPAFDATAWREQSRRAGAGENGLDYDFVVYERGRPG